MRTSRQPEIRKSPEPLATCRRMLSQPFISQRSAHELERSRGTNPVDAQCNRPCSREGAIPSVSSLARSAATIHQAGWITHAFSQPTLLLPCNRPTFKYGLQDYQIDMCMMRGLNESSVSSVLRFALVRRKGPSAAIISPVQCLRRISCPLITRVTNTI